MFKIIEGDFKNNKYSDEEYLDNWPMLYISVRDDPFLYREGQLTSLSRGHNL